VHSSPGIDPRTREPDEKIKPARCRNRPDILAAR